MSCTDIHYGALAVPDYIHSSLHRVLMQYISSTRTSVSLQDIMSRSYPCWHASRACKINLMCASAWYKQIQIPRNVDDYTPSQYQVYEDIEECLMISAF